MTTDTIPPEALRRLRLSREAAATNAVEILRQARESGRKWALTTAEWPELEGLSRFGELPAVDPGTAALRAIHGGLTVEAMNVRSFFESHCALPGDAASAPWSRLPIVEAFAQAALAVYEAARRQLEPDLVPQPTGTTPPVATPTQKARRAGSQGSQGSA